MFYLPAFKIYFQHFLIRPKAIQAFIKTGYGLYFVNRFRYQRLLSELNAYLQPSGLLLDDQLKKRIWNYTLQSAATNTWFAELRGYKASKMEINAGIYLGAYTPVHDDLVDEHSLDHEAIVQLQEEKNTGNIHYALISFLYKKLKDNIPDIHRFNHYFQLCGEAQTASLQQLNPQSIELPALQKITFDKGGYATLLYRNILQNKLLKGEEDAIYNLGASLQLVNDMFDVYKDHQNHVQTLPSSLPDLNLIATIFKEKVQSTITSFSQLSYPTNQKENMLWLLKIMLSRGFVCLEQLQSLPGALNSFSPGNYTRQQLICDMEKPKNIGRSLAVASKL